MLLLYGVFGISAHDLDVRERADARLARARGKETIVNGVNSSKFESRVYIPLESEEQANAPP
jgi:hypothetical protein